MTVGLSERAGEQDCSLYIRWKLLATLSKTHHSSLATQKLIEKLLRIERAEDLARTVCMDHIGWRCHNLRRVAVIDNGIGQVQSLNYLGEVQMKIEQGEGLSQTVCTDCVY